MSWARLLSRSKRDMFEYFYLFIIKIILQIEINLVVVCSVRFGDGKSRDFFFFCWRYRNRRYCQRASSTSRRRTSISPVNITTNVIMNSRRRGFALRDTIRDGQTAAACRNGQAGKKIGGKKTKKKTAEISSEKWRDTTEITRNYARIQFRRWLDREIHTDIVIMWQREMCDDYCYKAWLYAKFSQLHRMTEREREDNCW